MINEEWVKRVVINFLFYKKRISPNDAEEFFYKNLKHFEFMYDLLGDDLFTLILKDISKPVKKIKKNKKG